MVLNKRGQGLSLSVIIIAALALIVLVVLVMVFTGRIGVFEKGLSEEGKTELIKMRIQYGDCRPTATAEATFDTELSQAESTEAKEQAKASFISDQVDRCKALSNDKGVCEAGGCKWS